jgi:hypothetical protein
MSDIWELTEYNAKDLLLKNDMVNEKGVSEMLLNITHFAAIDQDGKEHPIKDLDNSKGVNLKGTHTGLFLKTNSAVDLKPGRYNALRFHLGNMGNTITLKDRSERKLSGYRYLDFEIQNGLEINGEDQKPLILRFDFEPFTVVSFFKPLTDLFRRQKRSVGKLVNSLAQ